MHRILFHINMSVDAMHVVILILNFLDWVVQLGPETFGEDNLYQYSVITDPGRVTLFVLARDIDTFEAEYEAEVLDWLENNGFNSTANEPIKTYHDDTCLYPEDESMF